VYPSPNVGDYAYIKGATSSDPAAIYECTTAGTWSDSGRIADTSNVQTFASGEKVNEIGIDNKPTVNSNNLVKSGGVFNETKVLGINYDISDAEIHQVNTGSAVDTSNGTRLRLLYYVYPGYVLSASCTLGAGVSGSVYTTREYALIADSGIAQRIEPSYVSSINEVAIVAEGYLCISLKKSDGSRFSEQEKNQFINATNISIKKAGLVDEVGIFYDKSNCNIFRAITGSESLVDKTNGTRLRCICPVKKGFSYDINSTDEGGLFAGVFDTEAHAARASTEVGILQLITSGYIHERVTGIINSDGFLSVSLTNGSTAISDSKKQEMTNSISLFLGNGIEYKVNTPQYVNINDVNDDFEQPLRLYITDSYMQGVNHRGYSVGAPENTLPAYILSYKHGFKYVECDIAFTSDGVPVLLHDSTIDRTSDGTGNINELTYEQVLQYDFGSWFSQDYVNTKIPTLMEFLSLCRNLGLHPYLEIKSSSSYTTEQIHEIVDIVEAYGMKGNVTYLSFNASYLSEVVSYDEYADVNYVVYSITDAVITTAEGLRTGKNVVYIGSQSYTNGEINKCKAKHFPLSVWVIDNPQTISTLDQYISSVTSNSQNAALIRIENELK
jgi:glycerophosphoryl diester phosphodiesterase